MFVLNKFTHFRLAKLASIYQVNMFPGGSSKYLSRTNKSLMLHGRKQRNVARKRTQLRRNKKNQE